MKIKAGKKRIDYRAAHITFEDMDNGHKMFVRIVSARCIPRSEVPNEYNKDVYFGDDELIVAFHIDLEKEKKKE